MKLSRILFALSACLVAAVCLFVYMPNILGHGERSEPAVARILFVGDMMFDRTIRTIGEERGYGFLFSCLDPYLRGFDLVIGNLEGPMTLASSTSVGTKPGIPGNTSFTFSPFVARELAEHNVRAVNLGNNHILDRGYDGIESTQRALEASGIAYFGAPGSNVATTTVVGGKTVSLVNFNQFLGENDPEKTIQAIKALKAPGVLVAVYAHWGEEYVPETDLEISLAHSFIDAGADMVIGSHPHVIQSVEAYKGKLIYYSLGNFIFDQYFDPAVMTGMGVEATIVDNTVISKIRLFDITRGGTTCIMQSDGR